MSSVFSDNISFIGNKPNFERDRVKTIAELLSEEPAQKRYPYGHIVFCEENGKHYKFNYNHKKPPTDTTGWDSTTGWFTLLDAPVDFTEVNNEITENSNAITQETVRAQNAEEVLSESISNNEQRISDIENVISQSPEMLDTLTNIAAWIEDDSTGSADVIVDVQENKERIEQLSKLDLRYGLLKYGTPNFTTSSKTLTIPSGTSIMGAGKVVTLTEDLIIDNSNDSGFGSHYIIIDLSDNTATYRLIRSNTTITLNNNYEVVLALLDWTLGFIWINSKKYKVNDVEYHKEINTNTISGIQERIEKLSKLDLRYGLLKYGTPNFTTSSKTLTIPSGTSIMGAGKVVTLTEDLIIDNSSDSEYGSHYIIIDLSNGTPTYRLIRSNTTITFNNNYEVVLALLDWALGFIWINSKTYKINDVEYHKEINTNTINGIQEDIKELSEDKARLELETKGYDAVCLGSYVYFPPIETGDKISLELLTDSGDTKIAVYLSDKQWPSSGYAVNVGYVTYGSCITVDIPSKFGSVSYIKLWANGLDDTEKVVRIKSLKRTLKVSSDNVVRKMLNIPVNFKKENLKILDIGNSYTENSTQYINGLLESAGANAVKRHSHYIAVRGGASFKSWYDCYNEKDVTARYYIAHKSGVPLSSEASFTEVTELNDDSSIKGEAFRNLLNNTAWDLIIIHQASAYSADYTKWETQESSGYLKEFIRLIKRTNPQAAIGTYLIHSYNTNHSNYTGYGSSLERWSEYADAVKSFMKEYGIDFVIPYGTAVQNLRASSLNDENQFSHDGTHLGRGLGCYVASCCYFQAMFAPIYDTSVVGNKYNEITFEEAKAGEIPVNSDNAIIAQKAAMFAVCDMFNVNNPELYENDWDMN